MKQPDLMNRFLLSYQRLQSLNSGLTTYAELRDRLTKNFGAAMNGRVGTTDFTAEQLHVLAPQMTNLEVLANDIRQRSTEDLADAAAIANQIGPAIQAHFGADFPTLKVDPHKVNDEELAKADNR